MRFAAAFSTLGLAAGVVGFSIPLHWYPRASRQVNGTVPGGNDTISAPVFPNGTIDTPSLAARSLRARQVNSTGPGNETTILPPPGNNNTALPLAVRQLNGDNSTLTPPPFTVNGTLIPPPNGTLSPPPQEDTVVPTVQLAARALIDVTVHTDNDKAVVSVDEPFKQPDANGDRTAAIAELIIKVVDLVEAISEDDKAHREDFTKRTVADVYASYKPSNVIVCNVGYDFQGTILSRNSVSFKQKIGAAVSYDVITFDHGTFDRHGDGGFINWAYIIRGDCTADGGHIHCP